MYINLYCSRDVISRMCNKTRWREREKRERKKKVGCFFFFFMFRIIYFFVH